MPPDGDSFGLEVWRDFARPFFEVVPTVSAEDYRAYAECSKVGRLLLSNVGFDAAIFDRDPGRFRGFDTEFLLLETYDVGENHGRSGDLVTRLETQAFQIFDMADPWRTQTTLARCRSVVIPYDLIGYDPDRDSAYSYLAPGSPRNAMLRAAMNTLFDIQEHLDPLDADALVESFAVVVRRLMFPATGRDVVDERPDGSARFLRQFIKEHLAAPDLGPQLLCDALGVSRAALYRMFPEEGGIRGYITGRRLDRCFDELRSSPPTRGRVRQVAERWGFGDAKSFNRAFRARFEIAPSDCLGQPDGAIGVAGGRHPMNKWMRGL